MATAQLGAVLRHIRSLAADHKASEQTDGALLRAFLGDNDQRAFEAIMRRHGPMVLRVCRRTLGNAHDAEDSFQATFLLLARRAASIRNRESLASWLHGVAYRMATHAKRAAGRRHKHESQANPTPPQDPALCAAWQEIQVLLDEEIQGLPEILREPFVSCCLENKSCAEAARRLGLKEGTVWNRLGRARKVLQDRLTRRGVSLTAVLAAAALGANGASAAVSRSLVGSTVKAAVQVAGGQTLAHGLVPAKVITLVKGVNQAMFLTKCKTVIVLLFSIAIVGGGLGLAVLHGRSAEPPPPAQKAPQDAARDESKKERPQAADAPKNVDAKDEVKVRGQVLDPDGKPFTGATLYLGGHTSPKEPTYPVRATSGDDGRFEFTFAKSTPSEADSDNAPRQVLAVAKGYGCAWGSVGPADKELTLRLVKDAAVSGRIVDADGRPVANAKLTVDAVAAFTGAKKSGVVFAYTTPLVARYPWPWDAANGWPGPLPDQGIVLTTSADGRFTLTGVGPGRVVSLHLEAPGIATTDLGVISGTPVQHVAVASRPVRGVVRDKASGRPLAGATVFVAIGGGWWSSSFDEDPDEKLRWGKTVTDKEGRYELLGLPKPPNYNLGVKPPKSQLYFTREVGLGDTPGLAALVADIDMVQGVTVRGKVTDKATHKPIAGARVFYGPLMDNPNASRAAVSSEATTEPDGSYALTVHRGPGVIAVICRNPEAYMPALVTAKEQKEFFTVPQLRPGNETWLNMATGGPLFQANYNALVLLEPKEGDKAPVKDIALERPLDRKGRVVGPDGQPIPGVTVTGLSPGQYGQHTETLEGTEFTVRGINPRAKRLLIFHHKEKNLGYCLKELPDEKLGPLTIKLQPCGSISGRLVDRDGVPVVTNRRVYIFWPQFLTPDKDGRFHVQGLVPGLEYQIMDKERAFELRGCIVAEPGKDKDLGDIKVSDN